MLVLASNSATRAQILKEAGFDFIQKGVDFDEGSIKNSSASKLVYQIAKGKWQRYMSLFGEKDSVICADTVVVCKGRILGKANDASEARQMLELQSGAKVDILTAMIYHTPILHLEELAITSYLFESYDPKDLQDYLESNEWEGKAGACMVEGFCKPYIKNVLGFESTAKGLCIETLKPFLDF